MFLYILKSLKDNGYYIGISQNVKKRLLYHNNSRIRSTKNRRPFKIVYQEECGLMLIARKREKYLKSYKGCKEKLSLVENSEIV